MSSQYGTSPFLMSLSQQNPQISSLRTSNVTPKISLRPSTDQQLMTNYNKKSVSFAAPAAVKVEVTTAKRNQILSQTARKEAALPLLTINKSSITLYSWEEMMRITDRIRVTNKNHNGDNSVNDPRMGIPSLSNACQYCSQIDCPGHYGLIDFGTPIYNPAFIRETVAVLTCVCNSCGGLLITEDVMREKGYMKLSQTKRLSAMEAYCNGAPCLRKKEDKSCINGEPRKGGVIIPCTKNPIYETKDIRKKGVITYRIPSDEKGQRKTNKKSSESDAILSMSIEQVMNILDCISLKDCALLGFPSYHRRLAQPNVIKVLNRSKETDLDIYGLNASGVNFINRPFEEVHTILNGLNVESLKLLGFPAYRKIYSQNDIFVVLSRANPELLTKVGLTGSITPDIVFAILNTLTEDWLTVIGLPSYSSRYSKENILSILSRVDSSLLERATLNTPTTTFSDRPFNEVTAILNSMPDDWIIALGFNYSHKGLTPAEVINILKLSPVDQLIATGLNADRITFLTRPFEGVVAILNDLSEKALKSLGFLQGSHPRNNIQRGILVPPPIARPPVYEGGSILPDQLTEMYELIVQKVINVEEKKPDAIGELYTTIRQLIFKSDERKLIIGREFMSIIERIQGKSALLRGLLMGKRNNYFGRTVAGPDSSLKFGQIRLPEIWASILAKPEIVTDFNMERLVKLAQNGRITHVTPAITGLRRYYDKQSTYELKVGDKVERWLQNGDRVVVNRQPTLHRQSMMAYEVILSHELNIGLHLSYCAPKNCDFDGDEVNAWIPQDFEVEAEAEFIMNVKQNLMSQEQNRPMMGGVMNTITGAYILTNPVTRVNDDLFSELLGLISNKRGDLATLYNRLVKYGVHPRSGQSVFSALLPSTFYYRKGPVLIYEGILVSGRIKKDDIGATHRSIVQELYKSYGIDVVVDFLTEAPWVIGKWLVETGFSVGILDMTSFEKDDKGKEHDKNTGVVKKELAEVYFQLEALGGKIDDISEENFRQRKINNLVNVAQGVGYRLAKDVLSGNNSLGIMTDQGAGTKGNIANVGQLSGLVGQQYYRGKRLQPTITGGKRLLPTYDEDDNNPEANAFISSSFYEGLGPEALFFLQAGGREGLLDTATKTSETGSMQHHMIKAFENIIVAYDGSIRNTVGTMFSPIYNSGYDIGEMVKVDAPGRKDFSSFMDIKSLAVELNMRRGWVETTVNDKIQANKEEIQKEVIPQEQILSNINIDYDTPVVTKTDITYKVTDPVIREAPITKITKFEKARIIGSRARQLSNNAQLLIDDVGETNDLIDIATKEYMTGNLPLYIIRRIGNGTYRTVYPTLENI